MSDVAILAAGCFWGIEEKFISTKGVTETEVGYIGGNTSNPTYRDVCTGNTSHAEAVRIFFNSEIISYDALLDLFFTIHDPTTLNQQGPDRGTQYRSAIFYLNDYQKLSGENKIKELNAKQFQNRIVTTLEETQEFWIAEEYHQKYIRKQKFSNYIE